MITKDDVIEYFKEKRATEFDSPVYIAAADGDGILQCTGGCDESELMMLLILHMRTVQRIMKNNKEHFAGGELAEHDQDFLDLIDTLYIDSKKKFPKYFGQGKAETKVLGIPRWMDNGSRG